MLAGCALLPPLAAAIAFVTFPLTNSMSAHGRGARPSDSLDGALAFAAGVGLIGLLVTVCAAIPTVFALRQRHNLTAKSLGLAGVLLGNLPNGLVPALYVLHNGRPSLSMNLNLPWPGPGAAAYAIFLGSFIGMLCGVAFWVMTVRGIRHNVPT
jgi:hypothetical protein